MPSANPNDIIRDHLLRKLYEIAQRSRSARMVAIGTRELQKEMRESFGYKQQEISANLDYLVDKGWAKEVVEDRTFKSKAGATYSSDTRKYKISSAGVDLLEKTSLFKKNPLQEGYVNITNINGVVNVGDGNVVNAQFSDVSKVLQELRKQIEEEPKLTDEDRLNAISDLDSLTSQMQKPKPNWSIIRPLWEGVKAVAAVGGAAETIAHASTLLNTLIK